jgi:hypothetical protein
MEKSSRECFWELPTYAVFGRQELLLVTDYHTEIRLPITFSICV